MGLCPLNDGRALQGCRDEWESRGHGGCCAPWEWEVTECRYGFRGTRAMGLCPLDVGRGCQGNRAGWESRGDRAELYPLSVGRG